MRTAQKTLEWKAPQALWSAAACCRFCEASLLARLSAYGVPAHGQQAGLGESGSKLPHSRAFALLLVGLLFLAGCGQRGGEAGASSVSYGSTQGEEVKAQLFTVPAQQMAHVQVTPVEVTRLPRVLRLTGSVAYNNFKTTPVGPTCINVFTSAERT
jgi:hypothetical protein